MVTKTDFIYKVTTVFKEDLIFEFNIFYNIYREIIYLKNILHFFVIDKVIINFVQNHTK